jgi:hypothetical protein
LYTYKTLPSAVALEDVNGDLKPDLVLLFPGKGNGDEGAMVVFLNTGTAPYFDFSNPLVYPIPPVADPGQAEFMAVADLNNDGLNDLVVLNPTNVQTGSANRITSYLNATQNPPTRAVMLTYGQQISNGNDIVNVQLPTSNGLGSAPTPQQPPLGSPVPPADEADLHVHDSYRKILQREAESAGRASWVGLLNSGVPRSTIVQGIWESLDHRGLQVDRLSAPYRQRAADPQRRNSWVNSLVHGMSETEASGAFLTAEEDLQAPADTTASLNALDAGVLGRTRDAAGPDAWQQPAQGGLSRAALADGFLQSPAQAKQLVDQNYARYLVRPADVPGKPLWTGALLEHRLTEEQVAQAFLAADDFFAPATGGL